MSTRRLRLLRVLLVAGMASICVAVVTVYVGYRHFHLPPPARPRTGGPQALMSMDRVHHTATRNGRVEWILDARKARTDLEGAVMHLTDLTVRFFPTAGGPVNLGARQGRLHVVSSDIEVRDRVVIENETYRLETESLTYDHDRRCIRIPGPVSVRGAGDVLGAAAMTIFIDDRRVELDGEVQGIFHGSLPL